MGMFREWLLQLRFGIERLCTGLKLGAGIRATTRRWHCFLLIRSTGGLSKFLYFAELVRNIDSFARPQFLSPPRPCELFHVVLLAPKRKLGLSCFSDHVCVTSHVTIVISFLACTCIPLAGIDTCYRYAGEFAGLACLHARPPKFVAIFPITCAVIDPSKSSPNPAVKVEC